MAGSEDRRWGKQRRATAVLLCALGTGAAWSVTAEMAGAQSATVTALGSRSGFSPGSEILWRSQADTDRELSAMAVDLAREHEHGGRAQEYPDAGGARLEVVDDGQVASRRDQRLGDEDLTSVGETLLVEIQQRLSSFAIEARPDDGNPRRPAGAACG